MANKEQLEILKQGKVVWNEWREKNPQVSIDLTNADLSNRDLSWYNFTNADLSDTQFHSSKLEGVRLSHAKLLRTNFYRAYLQVAIVFESILTKTDFSEADLCNCNLTNSEFSMVNFEKAKLDNTLLQDAVFWSSIFYETDFRGCIVNHCVFANTDLSMAIGLDKVNHGGPTSIGIDTFYQSKGKIPESFLRGCGVLDDAIAYMNSLVNEAEPIQFYSCFISYSSRDEEFTKRLHSRMRDAKLRVWYAPEDMKGGRKIHEQIDSAIKVHDKLLVVISEHSIHSEWVLSEVRKALDAEKREHKRKLFPIRLVDMETLRNWELIDTDTGIDLAKALREYHIPDFSNWKDHDDFEKGFDKLLKDLQADL